MATGSNTSKIIYCRYCLTNTNEHIAHYFFKDKLDKYEKILEDIFNIQIYFSENKYLCLECERAITNAATVKKRVLDVQKKLSEQSDKLTLGTETVKEEIKSDHEDYFENCDDETGTGDTGTRDCDTGDSATRDCDTGDSEAGDQKDRKAHVKLERLENVKHKLKGKTLKQISVPNKRNRKGTVKTKQKGAKNTEGKKKAPPEVDKRLLDRKKNTVRFLYNSNMCLFTIKMNKYGCFFCGAEFLDMKTLRAHSQTHKLDKIHHCLRNSKGIGLKYVDISNLECKQCSHPCKDLDDLRVHLNNSHGETFDGTEHLLLPFGVEDGFDCVICQKHFITFKTLSKHMNCHSSEHVCEKCGLSFNSSSGLKSHIHNVHTAKQCKLCSAIFPTLSMKQKHLRTVHKKGWSRRRCPQCDMTFKYAYILQKHLIEKHGADKSANICKYCNKVFTVAANVKIHYQNIHLNLKRHGCSFCDMVFFSTFDKKRHELSHSHEKSYSCGLCDAKFKWKDSVRRHLMKKHPDSKIDRTWEKDHIGVVPS